MNWHYSEAGQQRGPVSQEEFDRLVATGGITDATLVWREGMEQWRAWGEVRAATPPVVGTVACGVCGRPFPADAVIQYEGRNICAECKPAFFRRLQEGGAGIATPVPGVTMTEEEILARDYQVDIGALLSRAWEVFKADPGTVIGATVLIYLCVFAANLVPYVGGLIALVVTGPLMGGYWLFAVRRLRGQEAGVNTAFSGFGPRFGQLFLTSLVTGLLSSFCILAGVAVLFGGAFALQMFAGGNAEPDFAGGAAAVAGGAVVAVGVLAYIYLMVAWLFALPLVSDKGYGFWDAMNLSRRLVNRHFWLILLLNIVIGALVMAGVLALCLGLLVAGPVAVLMLAGQYHRMFGDLAPRG